MDKGPMDLLTKRESVRWKVRCGKDNVGRVVWIGGSYGVDGVTQVKE